MKLVWDERKRTDTLRERGLDFAFAAELFAGFHLSQVDDRFDYGETRWLTIGQAVGTVLVIVWTPRDDSRRIISMRKANANETARYRRAIDRPG
jgi:uncharacterized DUF497 family protein